MQELLSPFGRSDRVSLHPWIKNWDWISHQDISIWQRIGTFLTGADNDNDLRAKGMKMSCFAARLIN
jgi:hypothetical protein